MSQTSVIFFGLLVGFIVFITLRGELQAYLAVIGLEGSGVNGGTGITVGPGGIQYGGPGVKPPTTIPYDPNIPYIP